MNTAMPTDSVVHTEIHTRRSRLPELDGLRGVAILFVLLYHYISLVPGKRMPWLQGPFALGWSGVDLFFVLSGFLIGGILLDARESPNYFKTFYMRRAFRIMPLYYLWIGVFFAITWFQGIPENWRSISVYVLFLQNFTRVSRVVLARAWLSHLWSLSVEEQFYLSIPLAIRFLERRKLVVLLCFVIAMAPFVRVLVHEYLPTHPAAQNVLTMCRADALAMGVLLAVAWRDERCKAKFYSYQKWISGVVLLLLGVFFSLSIWQPSQYSLAMAAWGYSAVDAFYAGVLAIALMVPGGTVAAVSRWSLLAQPGRISYCLYVIHPVVSLMCHQILLHAMPRIDSWRSAGVTALAALLAYGLATLSWKYYEHPLLRRGHAFTY